MSSIYEKNLDIQGYLNLTLSPDDRSMLINALNKCLDEEKDMYPAVFLIKRLLEGD